MVKENMSSSEEMAEIHKERHISDGKLLEEGAKGKFNKEGHLADLMPTEKQKKEMKNEHEGENELANFIHENKYIICPADQIPADKKEVLKPRIAELHNQGWSKKLVRFIDDDGNISGVKVDFKNVDFIEYNENAPQIAENKLKEMLTELGYTVTNEFQHTMTSLIPEKK